MGLRMELLAEGIALEVVHRGRKFRVIFPRGNYIGYITQVLVAYDPFAGEERRTLPLITVPDSYDHYTNPRGRLLIDLEHPHRDAFPKRLRYHDARYKAVLLTLDPIESTKYLLGAAVAAGRTLYIRMNDTEYTLNVHKYNFSVRLVPRVLFKEGLLMPQK